MPAIEHLLKRMGFVRLSRYGLLLTPEGRIMSLRPAVLDDGMGGRIVGWADRDLAAAELARWEPARPAPRGAVATPPATPMRISPPMPARVITPLAPPPISGVAAAVEPEEDEWEWEIALARARTCANEIEVAVAAAVRPPLATVAIPREEVTAEWPKTEPLGTIDYEDRTSPANEVVRIIQIAEQAKAAAPVVIPQPIGRAIPRAKSPSTIIPVPRLPRVTNQNLEPVVRTRFPKATPHATPIAPFSLAPPPPIRPAEDEKTSPGFALPVAVISLPHIPSIVKRR